MNDKLKRDVIKLSDGVFSMRDSLATSEYLVQYELNALDEQWIYMRASIAEELLRKYHEESRQLLGRARRSRTMSRKIAEEAS